MAFDVPSLLFPFLVKKTSKTLSFPPDNHVTQVWSQSETTVYFGESVKLGRGDGNDNDPFS